MYLMLDWSFGTPGLLRSNRHLSSECNNLSLRISLKPQLIIYGVAVMAPIGQRDRSIVRGQDDHRSRIE